MSCRTFQTHLDGLVDSELASDKEVLLLAHAEDCPACAELFRTTQAGWTRVRALLTCESPSPSFRAQITVALLREDARLARRRWLSAAIPAALAASVALFLFRGQVFHGHDDHGPVIDFAVERYLDLRNEAVKHQSTILDPELLRKGADDVAVFEGERLATFYRDLFGDESKIPEKLRARSVRGAFRRVGFQGTPVSNLILDLQDQEVSVYRLRRDQAVLRDLHLVDGGMTDGLRIERCRSCHVIAVTRGDTVYVLVSKDGIEPMIALLRQTY